MSLKTKLEALRKDQRRVNSINRALIRLKAKRDELVKEREEIEARHGLRDDVAEGEAQL